MAAAPDPGEVLRSTDGKANFQRLVRLLISGGTSLLREKFDAVHPPSNLPTVLSNPAIKKQLKAAKLTKPQRDCLYPSPGVYGKSIDFDVTLLFCLLRTITRLTPPTTGWDALPASTDHSLTADLVRIKYYRNSVYGHVNQKMEIPDDQFLTLWQEISEALVRIAAQISREKKTAWQEAIDDYRKDPLTADDERNVKELERWYNNDMDVKKSVEELKTTTQEGIDHLKSLKTNLNDFQVEFEETSRMMERGAHCLETAVREEAQDMKDQLEEIHHKLIDILASSDARSRSTGEEAKMILKELWKTYHTGQVNEMEQTFLVAETFLKKHRLIEEYTACRQGVLKSPVSDPASMENDDCANDLPENQESLNQIREQFTQLHRLRVELQNTLFRWIRIRERTTGELRKHTHRTLPSLTEIVKFLCLIARAAVDAARAEGAMADSKELDLKDVLAAIDEDRQACIELQQQLDSLESFISTMAKFLKPLHNDPVLLRELEIIKFEFLREWKSLSLKDIFSSIRQLPGERVDFLKCNPYAFHNPYIFHDLSVTPQIILESRFVVSSVALLPLDSRLLIQARIALWLGARDEFIYAAREDIRLILDLLKCPHEEEIPGLVQSFIDEKFTEAYNRLQINKDFV